MKPGSRGVFQGPRTNSVLDYFVVCKFGHVDRVEASRLWNFIVLYFCVAARRHHDKLPIFELFAVKGLLSTWVL